MLKIARVRQLGSLLNAIVLSVVIFVSSACHSMPLTARGIQCPTAAVQAVKDVVAVRDCCGRLHVSTVIRKPKEGESGFKQCRCAEKKAAAHEGEERSAESKPVLNFAVLERTFMLDVPILAPVKAQLPMQVCPLDVPPAFAPPTPPPQFI